MAPVVRSVSASRKAAAMRKGDDDVVRGFRELLDHLATLTCSTMTVTTETRSSFELLSTPTQRRDFELLGAAEPDIGGHSRRRTATRGGQSREISVTSRRNAGLSLGRGSRSNSSAYRRPDQTAAAMVPGAHASPIALTECNFPVTPCSSNSR